MDDASVHGARAPLDWFVYTFSMWNAPLTHQLGVVAQAAGDWQLGDVLGVFSMTAVSLGTTTFVLGPWQERAGPRYVAAVAGTCLLYTSPSPRDS